MATKVRRERVHFRVTEEDKSLFRVAAELKGLDMSEFLVSTAREAAERAIEDQRDFVLSPERYAAFVAALDRPPVEKPRLRRLFAEPSVLEPSEEDFQVAVTR